MTRDRYPQSANNLVKIGDVHFRMKKEKKCSLLVFCQPLAFIIQSYMIIFFSENFHTFIFKYYLYLDVDGLENYLHYYHSFYHLFLIPKIPKGNSIISIWKTSCHSGFLSHQEIIQLSEVIKLHYIKQVDSLAFYLADVKVNYNVLLIVCIFCCLNCTTFVINSTISFILLIYFFIYNLVDFSFSISFIITIKWPISYVRVDLLAV